MVYANDCRDKAKQEKAIGIITGLMKKKTGVISTQVLQEYAAVALGKLGQRHEVVLRQLMLLETFHIISVTPFMVRRSIEINTAYAVSFWDSAIIAAAEQAQCSVIYSEDLNPGQLYSGIRIVNPLSVDDLALPLAAPDI